MTRPIRRIMVYVDGSERSLAAAQWAIVLARTLEAELSALAVVNTRALNELVRSRIFLESEQEEYSRDLSGDTERHLRQVRELARAKGLAVETENASGAVHQLIQEKALALRADLVVLGESAHVRSRRDELWDETERAMRGLACPVLLVKDEEKAQDLYDALD